MHAVALHSDLAQDPTHTRHGTRPGVEDARGRRVGRAADRRRRRPSPDAAAPRWRERLGRPPPVRNVSTILDTRHLTPSYPAERAATAVRGLRERCVCAVATSRRETREPLTAASKYARGATHGLARALRRKNRTRAAPGSPIPAGHPAAHTRRPTCHLYMRSAPSGLASQSRSISATSPSSCAPQRRLRLTRQARQPAVQGVGTAIPITDTPWAQRVRA